MKKDLLIVIVIVFVSAGAAFAWAAFSLPSDFSLPASRLTPAVAPVGDSIPLLPYQVIDTRPHRDTDYTQGLVLENGVLYESTGQYGYSLLRASEFTSGKVLAEVPLAPAYFGEGIAVAGDRLLQLTWKEGRGFIYDKQTLNQTGEFVYSGEGWGLAFDGKNLIMSDGSATLRFLHPQTLAEESRLRVTASGQPLDRLNELEFARGRLYANIWQTDRIAEIDPQTGAVTAWLDLSGLYPPSERAPAAEVLNGIAYDAQNDHFLITGKYWPTLFLLKLGKPVLDSSS
jgi:glutamine cyclotransferase